MSSKQLHEIAEEDSAIEQIKSFSWPYWAANIMEMIERWAYYGVRTVLSLYIVDAAVNGGLEFNHIQKGSIYAWWAVAQSLLPMFTGGYADRYGYRLTVAFSISIKATGYLLMATQKSYEGFFLGCMLLATGTALFKPGVQGIIANSTTSKNASVGWGIFYAIVNIGGFLGPWASGYLRVMSWSYMFYANAAIVCLNYLMLLTFKLPPKIDTETKKEPFLKEFFSILYVSVKGVLKPRLFSFLIIFSGFWLMFMQLFDILPNYIDDWVDSSDILLFLGNTFALSSLTESGLKSEQVLPEWMINIDSFSIIIFMIPISALMARFKAINCIIVGILISAIGLFMAGYATSGIACAVGIIVFSFGEMMSGPKKLEYLASIAPDNQRGLYMGYANVPLAIGWGVGSSIGGHLYEGYADKVILAKKYLTTELHVKSEIVSTLEKQDVIKFLSTQLNKTPKEATEILYQTYSPSKIWLVFIAIGVVSMVGMIIYDYLMRKFPEKATP